MRNVGHCGDYSDSIEIQVSLCEKLIEWCEAEKRTFPEAKDRGEILESSMAEEAA